MAGKHANQCCDRNLDELVDGDETNADYSVEETNAKEVKTA